ncbi:MAG: WecB/TagA/CpsF family glycosyltransferase [bacterium]
MRVLFPTVRDPDQIGGGATHLTMLAGGLKELGHEAEALYLTATMPGAVSRAGLIWPAGALNRMRSGWGMVYSADMRGRLLANATARKLERAAGGDPAGPWEVLNAQEVYSIPHLRSVADEHGIPLVMTLHGYPLYESVSEGYSTASRMGLHYLMRTEMQALRLADAIVTVDTRLYRHVLGLVPERADSVYTLMNFVDTSVFAPMADPAEEAHLRRELRAAWEIPEDRIVLLCPRRLVKKNGVVFPSLALAAMDPADRDSFLLLHAGDGGERGEIERIIAENHLEENVRLLGGKRPEAILELYRLADIVLVPSVHSENVEEATSLSALEAMASGRPLIAGDVGGLAEMVVDGETGLLVPADAEMVAAAILRLAAAPDLGARMAASAREYVVEKHSHLRAAASYAEVYRRALDGRSAARMAAAAGRAVGQAGETHPPGAAILAGAQPAKGASPPWPSLSVLGFTLDVVTLEQAAQWAVALAEAPFSAASPGAPGRTRIAVSFNPELVVQAQRHPTTAEALLNADLCYPDGVGAVWAAGRQGARAVVARREGAAGPEVAVEPAPALLERVPGIDLAQRVLQLAADEDVAVYFLGAAEGVAAEAARRQAELLPGLRVVGAHHGYFSSAEEDDVVRRVRESGARILLVAMGAPRQETLLHHHRDELGAAVALGVGGSFDVWAGTVKRAPHWTQKAKVEWLYRLASDPRRARRQLVLPRYAAQVLRWSPDDYGPPRRGRARRLPENLVDAAERRARDGDTPRGSSRAGGGPHRARSPANRGGGS